MENFTEINKTSKLRDDIIVRGRDGRRDKNNRETDEIDVLSDKNKKKQLIEAL